MFRRLYIPIALVMAIAIAVFAVLSGIIFAPQSVTANAHFDSANKPLEIVTDYGVLEQVNSAVHIKITSTANTNIQYAIGRSADVTSWLGSDEFYRILGLDTWTTFKVQQSLTQQGDKVDPLPESINSDMWEVYGSKSKDNPGDIEFDWIKKSGTYWSMLIVATPNAETEGALAGPLDVTLEWKPRTNQTFLIPGLLISIFLLISCVILHIVWRSQNAHGSHSGDSKKLVEIVAAKTGEFALPQSSQIPNVREFANLEANATQQSLLQTGQISTLNSYFSNAQDHISYQNSFYTTPVQNNDWRYYGDVAPAATYYENAISHTQTFNVDHSLMQAPNEIPIVKLSRKELREKGILKGKKRKGN